MGVDHHDSGIRIPTEGEMTVISRLAGAPFVRGRFRGRFGLLMATLAAAVAGTGLPVLAAHAFYTNYGSASYAPYDHRDSSVQPLTASQAYDDNGANTVCAAATLNGSFYGSYICGNGFGAHCYSGGNYLAGRAHNGESFSQIMHGRIYWSENCP